MKNIKKDVINLKNTLVILIKKILRKYLQILDKYIIY